MRAVAIALGCLAAVSTITPALAGGQSQLGDPKAGAEQVFWGQLYASGGSSLYCAKAFDQSHGQLMPSPVYASKQIKSALRCVTDGQCLATNPQYPYMLADLHNLYPELTRVELARRSAQFGNLGDDVPSKFAAIGCDLKSSFQLVEPRDAAKGNVARAIFYMHIEYGLPIVGQLQMFKQWHQMDPPDAEEHARNNNIASLQGNRNRFIDDPSQVELLIKD